MATSKSFKEFPSAIIFLLPWITYAIVYRYLPAKIPTHYKTGSKGLEVDAMMSPFSFLLVMTMVMLFIYGAMALIPAVDKTISRSQLRFIYYFKLFLLLFLALIPTYTLLTAAADLPDMSDTRVVNITMILLLAIINIPIYVVFRMQRRSASFPMSIRNHTILWVVCHILGSLFFLSGIVW